MGSAITTANGLAAPATTTVVAAAGYEVSAAISALFSSHAQQ
jgi:PE family